jgi:hypothetical protein
VLEVFATRIDDGFEACVNQIKQSVVPMSIRVVTGKNNNLVSLERLRDEIRARARFWESRGVVITGLGIDVSANKVGVGIKNLTQAWREIVTDEYGSDRVAVYDGQEFAPMN